MKSRKLSATVVISIFLALSLAVPAAASAAWGAIAINPKTGAVGVGFGESSKKKAQREAEHDCQGSCRQVLYVKNKCGAIAANPRRLTAGFGPTKKEAIKKAKKKARKGPGPAKLVAWVCSG
jgi:serine/threonine-protein kinase